VLNRARHPTHSHTATLVRPRRSPSEGQSVAEFALVIPILIILFLGIADFGRIFNAGVVLEAATRDAAEHASQLYLADPPGDPSLTPAERLSAAVPSPDPAYYNDLRVDAARVLCAETRSLPNTDYSGGACPTWPVVAVCVHDGADPSCGATPSGFAPPTTDCPQVGGAWPDPTPANGERWVEVRACYRFTSILKLPIFSFGDFYLERTRTFTIPCYFATGFGGCP